MENSGENNSSSHQIEEEDMISYPINDVLLSQTSEKEDKFQATTMKPPGQPPATVIMLEPPKTLLGTAREKLPVVLTSIREKDVKPVMDNGSGEIACSVENNKSLAQDENLKNRQNVCHICNKPFFYLYALKRHMTTHSTQVLSCNQCTKVFKHQSTLIQHKATHSQYQPFACDLCPKSFNRVSTLTSHRKTHSGVKPFVCHICNKGFYQKGNLKNHLFIHTNERPYRCHICNKGFNQMSNLVCHKRNAHCVMQSTYSCLICNLTFHKRDILRNHEHEVHFKNKNHLNQAAVAVESRSQQVFDHLHFPRDTTIQMTPIDSHLDVPALNNCQMIFERTKNHFFFSKYSVIELPEKIDTLEMRYAEMTNKTPFAVLHFDNQHPSLVQIVQQKGRSVLKPIKKQDLGRFSIGMDTSNNNGSKIVITIVASIFQSFVEGDYSIFTVKSPEVVRFVKLLIDDDVALGGQSLQSNCVQDQELKELKNRITIATSDSKTILDSLEKGEDTASIFNDDA